jgi:hypothetical protein
MDVDQKHITTIRLHDAKGSDIDIVKDGEDYQLRLASNNNVVNICLGWHDLRKICQQIMQLDQECWTFPCQPVLEHKAFVSPVAPRSFQETMASFFARMAHEMGEKSLSLDRR